MLPPKNGPLPPLRSGLAPWSDRRGNVSNIPVAVNSGAESVGEARQRLEHPILGKACPALPIHAPPATNMAVLKGTGDAQRQPIQENKTSQPKQTTAM